MSVEPEHLAANARLGACYAALGRHEDAVRALSVVRRLDPTSKAALEQLAGSLLQLGRKLEAVDALSARLALSPSEAPWLIRLGDVLADVSRFDDAAAAYARACTLPGAPPDAVRRLAALYFAAGEQAARDGKQEDAAQRFHWSISTDPRSEKPRLAMARALVALERPEDAMSAAHGALVAAPSSLEAALLLGDLYTKHGKHAEAAQVFEFASRSHPGILATGAGEAAKPPPEAFDVMFGLGKSLAVLGESAESIAALRRAVEMDPKHAFAAKILARALESANKLDEALPVWKAVVALEPEDGVANHRLGALLARKGDHEAAAAALAVARKAMPDDVDIALALAAAYEAQKRFDDAAPVLAAAARARPREASLHERLSSAHQASGRFDEAATAYQQVIDLGRRDAPAFLHLGMLHEQAKKHDQALRAYQEAYRLDQRSVQAIRHVARVLQATGRVAEGAQWLQGACGIDPRNAEVRYDSAAAFLSLGRRAEANAEYGVLCNLDTQLATKLYYVLAGR